MNRKQLAILLVLVVVLGGAGLVIYNKQNDTSKGGDPTLGNKLLGTFPINDVSHIAIKEGTNELNLVKTDDLWRVRERKDYPANYSEISDFLLKARDLKVLETQKASPADMARLSLAAGSASNSATVIDFRGQNEKSIKTLVLGKKHMRKSNRPSQFGEMGDDAGFPDGRYVKLAAESDTVALISEALANIEPKPEQWLNKDFFKVEKVKTLSVTFPVATNSWKMTRETESGEWKLADAKPGEQLDGSKTSSLSTPLNAPAFSDVATTATPEQLGLDKPTLVTLNTFDNFVYTLKVGPKTNDVYAMTLSVVAEMPKERAPGKDEKAEDKARLDKEFKEQQKKLEEKLAQEKGYEKWLYLVSSWTLEPVLKERSQLLVEKKEEPKKDDKAAASDAGADATALLSEPLKPADVKP